MLVPVYPPPLTPIVLKRRRTYREQQPTTSTRSDAEDVTDIRVEHAREAISVLRDLEVRRVEVDRLSARAAGVVAAEASPVPERAFADLGE